MGTRPPRVLSEEKWDRGADAPDVLERDPNGTVAKARGAYLRILGRDPLDETGKVARAREIAETVAREAERRRLVRDTAETEAKWDVIREKKRGPAYTIARNVWYGIPFTGAPELLYPELDDEMALTRGEWFEWANRHKEAGTASMIDHLASIIPPNEGESYREWRDRLIRRRQWWHADTDETVVNRSLFARPRQAEPQSPATSRTGVGRKARRRRSRQSRGAPTESPPQ